MRTILAWLVCIALVVFAIFPGCAAASSTVFGLQIVSGRNPVDPFLGGAMAVLAFLSCAFVIAQAIGKTSGLYWMGWLASVGAGALGILTALMIEYHDHWGLRLLPRLKQLRWETGTLTFCGGLAFISVALFVMTQIDTDDRDETPVTVEPIDEGPAPAVTQVAPSKPLSRRKAVDELQELWNEAMAQGKPKT